MKCYPLLVFLLNCTANLVLELIIASFVTVATQLKKNLLPKIVEGKWSGTMCLTEPVCGTDLGLLKQKLLSKKMELIN